MINSLPVGKNYQKSQNEKKNVSGAVLALGGATLVKGCSRSLNSFITKNFQKASKDFAPDEVVTLKDAAKKILNEKTNLAKKGVEIILPKIPKRINADSFSSDVCSGLQGVMEGKNAFFIGKFPKKFKKCYEACGIKVNSIVANADKMPAVLFHEIGHSFNYNNSAFWKAIQKLRGPSMFLASLIAFLPAFTKQTQPEEGKELSKFQKAENFVRKYSPAFVVALMIPTLAEEIKASLRGNKWAKELLNKDLAKKVVKVNKLGAASYVAFAGALALTAFVTKGIKDESDKKHAQVARPSFVLYTHQG